MTDPGQLLQEREKTHGSFAFNAAISQALKKLYRTPHLIGPQIYEDSRYIELCAVHREALDMIALKLSRILSGQADFRGHWDDIAGYAKLGSEACKSQ